MPKGSNARTLQTKAYWLKLRYPGGFERTVKICIGLAEVRRIKKEKSFLLDTNPGSKFVHYEING